MKQMFYVNSLAVFLVVIVAYPAFSISKEADAGYICIGRGGKPSLFLHPAIIVMRFDETTMCEGNGKIKCRAGTLITDLEKLARQDGLS